MAKTLLNITYDLDIDFTFACPCFGKRCAHAFEADWQAGTGKKLPEPVVFVNLANVCVHCFTKSNCVVVVVFC